VGSFGLLFLIHCLRHLALRNHGYDVSFIHQALFHPFGDPPLRADIAKSGTALGEHLVFSLYLLAPLTALIRSNFLVYFIQAGVIAGGMALLLRFGPLRDQGRRVWAYALIGMLAYKSLRTAVIWDFREDALAFLGFSILVAGIYVNRVGVLLAGFCLALLSKENMFLVSAASVIPAYVILVSRGSRLRAGVIALLLVAGSLAYGFFAFKYAIPHFAGNAVPSPFAARFGSAGASAQGMVARILTAPEMLSSLLREIFDGSVLRYAAYLLLPVIPFWRRREVLLWLIPAGVGIGMNVAHPYHVQRSMIFHYELLIFPFLFAALLAGYRSALVSLRPKLIALSLVLSLCVFGRSPVWHLRENFPTEDEWRTSRALANFEISAAVAVSARLSAQVNHLGKLRVFHQAPQSLEKPGALENWVMKEFGTVPEYWILDEQVADEAVLRDRLLGSGGMVVWGEPGRSRAVIVRAGTIATSAQLSR